MDSENWILDWSSVVSEKCFNLARHYTFLQKGRKLFCCQYNPKEKGEHCIIATWSGKRTWHMAQIGMGCTVTGFTDENTYRVLLSAVKSMATEMPSRKKLTLLCLSDNNVGCQIQWLKTLKKLHTISNQNQILFCYVVGGVHKYCCSHWFIINEKYKFGKTFAFCSDNIWVYVQNIQKKTLWEDVIAMDLCWCCGLNCSLGCSDL